MEIAIVKYIQGLANSFLDVFFWLITKLGEETVFLFVLAVVYLCYSKKFAVKISLYYLISYGINSLIKNIIARPRPHVASNEVINRLPASGYSFPSGHTQGYFSMSTTTFIEINKNSSSGKVKNIYAFSFILLGILVMISRLYWGQHYMTDVIVGMMFGLSIPFFLEWLFDILPNKIKNIFTLDRLYIGLGVLAIVVFIGMLLLYILAGFHADKVYKFSAVFIAMSVGYLVDKKWIKYQSNNGFKKGLIKAIIMIFILVGVYLLLNLFLDITSYVCFIVYLLLGMIVTTVLPLLFKIVFKEKV